MTPRVLLCRNARSLRLAEERGKLDLPLRYGAVVTRRMVVALWGIWTGAWAQGWSGKGVQGSGSDSKDKHGVLLLYSPLGCPWLPGQQKQ